MAATSTDVFCKQCKEKIDIRGKIVICKGECKKTFHKRCARVSDLLYTEICTNKCKIWKCKDCETKPISSSIQTTPSSPVIGMSPAHLTNSNHPQPSNDSTIIAKLETVIHQNTTMKHQIESLREELRSVVNEFTEKITYLQEENKELKRHLDSVNFRLNSIEQHKLKFNVEINGVTTKNNENLADYVLELGRKVGVTVNNDNITSVYRKKHKAKSSSTYPIIAVFNNHNLKKTFVKNCRKIQNLNTSILGNEAIDKRPLYVNHQITNMSQFLLSKAKEMKKQGLFKYVWVGEGQVLVRKKDDDPPIIIRNLSQLNEHKTQ